jgi:hypothetical protein
VRRAAGLRIAARARNDAALSDAGHPLLWAALAVLALAVAAVTVGCGGSRAAAAVPLIVDTDLSSDDVIALAVVASDPGVRLEAVTVSGTGLVDCPAGARLASSLLSALGRLDVPVACGQTLPLQRLVHADGGEIELQPRPGGGLVATVRLPAVDAGSR